MMWWGGELTLDVRLWRGSLSARVAEFRRCEVVCAVLQLMDYFQFSLDWRSRRQ